jgi:hypothetical protein
MGPGKAVDFQVTEHRDAMCYVATLALQELGTFIAIRSFVWNDTSRCAFKTFLQRFE